MREHETDLQLLAKLRDAAEVAAWEEFVATTPGTWTMSLPYIPAEARPPPNGRLPDSCQSSGRHTRSCRAD
ncbi:MAG: hypothetical protein R3C59_16990 [Planctomycetaceae bacterium]